MTDPARNARPVGPPPPPGAPPPPSRGAPAGPPPPPRGPYQGWPPEGPNVRVYRWSSGGPSIPWFAILLVVLGVALLIELVFPDLSFGSIIILAGGLAFGAAWLFRGVVGATMPALVLTGWGLASVLGDFGMLPGDGWTTLFIGIAFLLGWLLGSAQGIRRHYALPVGLVLGVIGLADVSDTLPFDLGLAVVIPLVMIGLGIYLVWQSGLLRGQPR